ncbi:cation transport protein chac [Ahrensia sp. R2A130]|nr:cation transport protein chac [Ahrensia sp. R2A130]
MIERGGESGQTSMTQDQVPADHFWVFGYGSLMWKPGFDYLERQRATMHGVHRSPCIFSWVHRGTVASPGIVMGLDEGGFCEGVAFKVNMNQQREVVDYLRARELVTNVYIEVTREGHLDNGETVPMLCYVADTTHQQYADNLSIDALVAQISGAEGQSGKNEDYILDTVEKMREMEIHDERMEAVAARLSRPG